MKNAAEFGTESTVMRPSKHGEGREMCQAYVVPRHEILYNPAFPVDYVETKRAVRELVHQSRTWHDTKISIMRDEITAARYEIQNNGC